MAKIVVLITNIYLDIPVYNGKKIEFRICADGFDGTYCVEIPSIHLYMVINSTWSPENWSLYLGYNVSR